VDSYPAPSEAWDTDPTPLTSANIRGTATTYLIKRLSLQNSKNMSDTDGDADFSIGEKKDLN
jgi:hypothetical protein